MKSNLKQPILILVALFLVILLSLATLWAANPATEKSPGADKKEKKLVVKGREFCIECIDNSECLGCHTKINERKFAQSVHGALSCTAATGRLPTSRPI
jgi:hypothetical protein